MCDPLVNLELIEVEEFDMDFDRMFEIIDEQVNRLLPNYDVAYHLRIREIASDYKAEILEGIIGQRFVEEKDVRDGFAAFFDDRI